MDTFWVVTLFHFQPSPSEWQNVESLAINEFGSLGIEEFSLTEAEVDEILGDRSYSGGDLSQDVIDEVESTVLGRPVNYRFFFDDSNSANDFLNRVRTEYLCES